MINFLAIEGLDGSGKSTQIGLLINHLSYIGIPYKFIHFPRYDQSIFGNLIAKFLQGNFGPVYKVDPYIVALLFSLDRFDSNKIIKNWINNNFFIIVDRYVYSNIAFQCAKKKEPNLKLDLENWIINLEYTYFKIPKPDLSIFLDVPFSFIENQLRSIRVGKDRRYLEGEMDIHESNIELQKSVQREYLRLTKENSDFILLDCYNKNGNIMDEKDIHKKLLNILNHEGI